MRARTATGLLVAVAVTVGGVAGSSGPARAATALSLGSVWSAVVLPGEVIRESSPLLVDLTADGVPDIVVGTMSGHVVAVNGATGARLWTQSALSATSSINSSPSAADVDGDGRPEIFVGSGAATANPGPGALLSFEHDGTVRAGFPLNVWDGVYPVSRAPGIHSSPAIGDVDQDGQPEVVFGTLAWKSIWSVSVDGQVEAGFPYNSHDTNFSTPALADLNGDGVTDFVIGQDQTPGDPAQGLDQECGTVRGIDGHGGTFFSVTRDEIVRSSPAVGDVDGDGQAEIVVGSGNYWSNPANYNANPYAPAACPIPDPGHVLVLSLSGQLERDITVGGSAFPSPALADVNGDGRADVVIGTSTQTGTGGGYVVAVDGLTGGQIWKVPARTGVAEDIIGGVSAADLNGDGKQDVLVPAGSGVYIHDGATGDVIAGINSGQVGYQNTPAVADMDNDGRLDIVTAGTRGNDGIIERWEVTTPGSVGALSWPTFHHDARRTGNLVPPPLTQASPLCAAAPGQGYWLSTADGRVYGYCAAASYGSAAGMGLNRPIVSMAATVSGRGYWLMAGDGGVFSYGDAAFYGSTGAMKLNQPIITAMPTPSGRGYWLIATDGGVFSFGDAAFYGSTGAIRLNQPIVTGMATPSGRGYWLIASDGGVFSFGDAAFYGSTGAIRLNQPIVTAAATPSGQGYWMFASDGGVFSFGDAHFLGSLGGTTLAAPVVASATP